MQSPRGGNFIWVLGKNSDTRQYVVALGCCCRSQKTCGQAEEPGGKNMPSGLRSYQLQTGAELNDGPLSAAQLGAPARSVLKAYPRL